MLHVELCYFVESPYYHLSNQWCMWLSSITINQWFLSVRDFGSRSVSSPFVVSPRTCMHSSSWCTEPRLAVHFWPFWVQVRCEKWRNYTLQGVCSELCLVDVVAGKLHAEQMDLAEGQAFMQHHVSVIASTGIMYAMGIVKPSLFQRWIYWETEG